MFEAGIRKRKILVFRFPRTRFRGDGTVALGEGYTAPSSDSPDDSGRAVVCLRKHAEGQIINGWLGLVALVGGAIAVVDGLTRAPNPGWEMAVLDAMGPLEYEPYYAAFLFAGVTLPLMLVYAKKVRASMSEALFLWFAFCTTTYMKDFSYLRWPGKPVFITDVVLAVLLLSIYVFPRPRWPRTPLALNIALFLFTVAGMLAAVRGFWEHRETILVLRDSALVAYSLFILVGYHLFRNWLSISRAAVWFLLGTALSCLNGLAWFFAAPEQRRFIAPGIYILISLVAVVLAIANRRMKPLAGWMFVGLFGLGLMLANARTLFVTLGVLLLFGPLCRLPAHKRAEAGRKTLAVLVPAALALVAAFLLLRTNRGRDFAELSAEQLDSGVLHSEEDPNWQFRLEAWKEAWRRFEEYPPAGEGFGILFVFGIWDNDPRPHNTFLTVLYKMGLIGFLPLLALLCLFFFPAFRILLHRRKNQRALFLQIVVIGELAFCLFGLANIALESPFLASLFWVGMGVGMRVIENLNGESRSRIQAHSAKAATEMRKLSASGRLCDAELPAKTFNPRTVSQPPDTSRAPSSVWLG